MTESPVTPPVEGARIVVDDQPIPFEAGDSVALAVLRTGAHPARGGTLCLAGDCGNCLAPKTCGGGGINFQCGCTPNKKACVGLGYECGSAPDGR